MPALQPDHTVLSERRQCAFPGGHGEAIQIGILHVFRKMLPSHQGEGVQQLMLSFAHHCIPSA